MDVLLQAVVEDVVGERRVALEVDAGRRGSVLRAPKEVGRLLLGLVPDGHDKGSLFRGARGVSSFGGCVGLCHCSI